MPSSSWQNYNPPNVSTAEGRLAMKPFGSLEKSPHSVLEVFAVDSPCTELKNDDTCEVPSFFTPPTAEMVPPLPPLPRGQSLRQSSNPFVDPDCFDLQRQTSNSCTSRAAAWPTRLVSQSSKPPAQALQQRSNSLNDSKVLLATNLKRSASMVRPELFNFDEHFEYQCIIGRSKLSEVYRVQHRITGEVFAVKRSMRKFKSKAHRERCMREILSVAALPCHPHVVGLYRAWQQGGHFYIQMDYCELGSLNSLLQQFQRQGTPVPEEYIWKVLSDVAKGLEFLHENDVLHLDIKPDNIYRDADGTLRIGDFGLAVLKQQWQDWEEGDGDYVAPELLDDHSEPSCAADIYSLGATIYECATGQKIPKSGPVRDMGQVSLPGRSSALQWVVQWMINPRPEQRPQAGEILRYLAQVHVPEEDVASVPMSPEPMSSMMQLPAHVQLTPPSACPTPLAPGAMQAANKVDPPEMVSPFAIAAASISFCSADPSPPRPISTRCSPSLENGATFDLLPYDLSKTPETPEWVAARRCKAAGLSVSDDPALLMHHRTPCTPVRERSLSPLDMHGDEEDRTIDLDVRPFPLLDAMHVAPRAAANTEPGSSFLQHMSSSDDLPSSPMQAHSSSGPIDSSGTPSPIYCQSPAKIQKTQHRHPTCSSFPATVHGMEIPLSRHLHRRTLSAHSMQCILDHHSDLAGDLIMCGSLTDTRVPMVE